MKLNYLSALINICVLRSRYEAAHITGVSVIYVACFCLSNPLIWTGYITRQSKSGDETGDCNAGSLRLTLTASDSAPLALQQTIDLAPSAKRQDARKVKSCHSGGVALSRVPGQEMGEVASARKQTRPGPISIQRDIMPA